MYRRTRIDKVTILGNKSVQLPAIPAVYERVHVQRIFEVHSDDATLQDFGHEEDSSSAYTSGYQTLAGDNSISKFLPVSIVSNKAKVADDLVEDFGKTASSFKSGSGIQLLPEVNDDNNETCEEELDYATQENKTEEFIYRPKVGDLVDQAIAEYMNSNSVQVPFFRIDAGKYMIGTEIVTPQMHKGVCIIKRNGLNETLDVFMSRNSQQMMERVQ